MNVILFGATGMVGQGALLECLDDPGVERVLVVVRRSTGRAHAKLRELIVSDFLDYSAVRGDLTGYDTCFFCLGVSSAGMGEAAYRAITYDLTLAAAKALLSVNPAMTFLYVSGTGTDSSEKGRSMWARVKGKTENDLLALPFKRAYMFRPAYIQPVKGVRSATGWYRAIYAVMGPLYPLWKWIMPKLVTTSEAVGRAMIRVARDGFGKPVVENADINTIAS